MTFSESVNAHFRPYATDRSDDGCVCTACGWIGDPSDLDLRPDDIMFGRVVGYIASCPSCGAEPDFDDLADHKPEGLDDAEARGLDILELLEGAADRFASEMAHDPEVYVRMREALDRLRTPLAAQDAFYAPDAPRPMSPAVAASHDDDVLLSTLRRGAELHDAEHDRALLRAIGGAA